MTDTPPVPAKQSLTQKLDAIQEGLLQTQETGVAIAADTALVTHFYRRTIKQLKVVVGVIIIAGALLGYSQWRVESVTADAKTAARSAKIAANSAAAQGRQNEKQIKLLEDQLKVSNSILAEFKRYQPGGDLYAEGQKGQAVAIQKIIDNQNAQAEEIKGLIRELK